ncbi:TIGR03618 family F420-dependent PPOX class oxidoreductase [Pseudonocardia dioxanivorans]|uniref:TIGR03618 family F420-dependent PPOX class oxidoreductase n=1 Tax=Pseudonocardia dioxanivorans TaxID=240495 RepID=UPI000CD2E4D6|nr:TIGR03618 family F420-dependent PPOX class oxidoreductase [Pseudonocardia dioxanivorans]
MSDAGQVIVDPSPEFRQFWTERHLCVLVTPRRDGSPHVVPVGVTLDVEQGIARVICSGTSQKARNVAAGGAAGVRAVVSQVDGPRWSSLEGVAVLRTDRDSVADAEHRYAQRYRVPRVNPRRVVVEITLDRMLGMR